MSNDIDDSFDDEFDFLEEEEFDDADNVTQKAAPKSRSPIEKMPINNKIVAISAGVIILAAAGYFVINKKSNSDAQMAQAMPTLNNESNKKVPSNIGKQLAVQLPKQNQSVPQSQDKVEQQLTSQKQEQSNDLTLGNLAASMNKTQEKSPLENKDDNENKESFEDFAKAFSIEDSQVTDQSSQMLNDLPQSESKQKATKKTSAPEVESSLKNLSNEMTQNINQIQMLQASIENLANKISDVNSSIGTMDNRMLSLAETVNSLTQDVVQVKKSMADDIDENSIISHKANDQPLIYNAPEYAVHAIIPGRAWLKSSNGQIITVTEGDAIGDYGKVAVIDANNSIVRTSSGISFR